MEPDIYPDKPLFWGKGKSDENRLLELQDNCPIMIRSMNILQSFSEIKQRMQKIKLDPSQNYVIGTFL